MGLQLLEQIGSFVCFVCLAPRIAASIGTQVDGACLLRLSPGRAHLLDPGLDWSFKPCFRHEMWPDHGLLWQ